LNLLTPPPPRHQTRYFPQTEHYTARPGCCSCSIISSRFRSRPGIRGEVPDDQNVHQHLSSLEPDPDCPTLAKQNFLPSSTALLLLLHRWPNQLLHLSLRSLPSFGFLKSFFNLLICCVPFA